MPTSRAAACARCYEAGRPPVARRCGAGLRVHWLWALFGVACAAQRPPKPWLADVIVTGPAPSGEGARWDPDLPPLRPTARRSGHEARWTSWTAERQVSHRVGHWFQRPAVLSFLGRPPTVDAATLAADADRLGAWALDQGFASAEVQLEIGQPDRWWVKPQNPAWRAARYTLDLGPRQVVGSAVIVGDEPLSPRARAALRRRLPALDTPWSDAASAALEADLRDVLADGDRPDAHAHVLWWPEEEGASAPEPDRWPTRAVAVEVRVEAPPAPTYGPTIVDAPSLDPRQQAALARAVGRALAADQTWDGRAVARLERTLSAVPGVDAVHVEAPRPSGTVVRASPAAPVVVGRSAGLGASGSLLSVVQGYGLRVARLGGRSWSLRADTDLGWRLFEGQGGILDLVTRAETGPALRHRIELEGRAAPRVPLGPMVTGEGAIEAWRGHIQARAVGEAGLRSRPSDRLSVDVGVQAAWSHHLPPIGPSDGFIEGFGHPDTGGLGYARTAVVTSLFARARYDSRDDGMLSRRGALLDAEITPWGLINGAPQSRWFGDLSWFQQLSPRIVLVTRGAVGLRFVDDDAGGDALYGKFFLGGPGSMRGFGFRRLGPPGSPGQTNDPQRGGDAMLYGSVEGRFFVHPDLALVGFVDAGRTWDAVADRTRADGTTQHGVDARDLVPVVGTGLMFRSPLGFFGLWAGVRLVGDLGMEPTDPPVFNLQFVGLRGRETGAP